MSKLEDYIANQVDETFLSTDDVVHAVLPLLKQIIQTHDNDKVAPLEGLQLLNIEQAGIWYAVKDELEIKQEKSKIRIIDPVNTSAFNVVSEASVTHNIGQNTDDYTNHLIIERGAGFNTPVYLPGYLTWEQEFEHHDPLCDIFVVGLIIASLSCNLNLNNVDDLKLFVENRSNLFNINNNLDPIIAKAIVQTTELSRHTRMPDIEALYRLLNNYREQETDIDFELLKISDFDKKQLNDKQQIILSKLQERLFEITKRNKLLHFTPSQQTINLTQASVPLTCDISQIKADSLLLWTHKFKEDVLKEKPVQLNTYVNMHEALYVPGILDRLRAEANRDLKEFGFAQLRLVLCFLSWTNLKESDQERFYSPLVLLPASLSKKKGIKDKYWLEPLDNEAEINPVIRHQFKELYDIDLPETIDIKKTDLRAFHQWLQAKIESSDQSVSLLLIDKPKVDLIHQAAKRRLEHYNRRAGISGRSILKYEDIDYSYNSKNLHPLGLRLFNQRVRIANTQLQRIVDEDTAIETPFMVDTNITNTKEKTKSFFSIRTDDEQNPYHWQFDMSNMTLGNFKYRKMSLVKDYAQLIDSPTKNQAFEATFSLNPRDIEDKQLDAVDITDRYHVVACDPTQAEAISLAKQGKSYIIQGPPGTGKSQTITNLIADYIARGKKILFVCEKRAAIDVVFLRLKQQGLGSICSLIHDSQTDKKHFIMDLKATYEKFIEQKNTTTGDQQAARLEILNQLTKNIQPIEQFDAAFTKTYESTGIPLNELLTLAIENSSHLPELTDLELEYYPDYSTWASNIDLIERFTDTLLEIQVDGVLANHPLALLHENFVDIEQPMNTAATLISNILAHSNQTITALDTANQHAGMASNDFNNTCEILQLHEYLNSISMLTDTGLMCLFDSQHATSKQFSKVYKKYLKKIDHLSKAKSRTEHWIDRLAADDTENALLQAQSMTGIFSFLKPQWWALRKILNSHYDFSAHTLKPSWIQILTWLNDEHDAQQRITDFTDEAKIEFEFDSDFADLFTAVDKTKTFITKSSHELVKLHETLITHSQTSEIIVKYLAMTACFTKTYHDLQTLLQGYEKTSLATLNTSLKRMNQSLEQLPEYLLCLKNISCLPNEIARIFRQKELNTKQIQTAIAYKTVSHLIKSQPILNRMVSTVKQQYVKSTHRHHQALYQQNSKSILSTVRRNFLEHMEITNLPAAKLSSEQKDFKKIYNKGRRELEHEFSKSIRFKSIRNMLANQSGIIINDLKRVWLMSPLSVSDTLPLNDKDFDVVIFDEASQITLEEAIPSIFRADQSIVVGDQMQLPPTNFFSARSSHDGDSLEFYEDKEIVEYDLNSNSFLSHVSNNLISRRLGWHYRSRSEALISFSNWAFYQGSLLTVPDVIANSDEKPPIIVTDPIDGDDNTDELTSRAVSFHWLERGLYENRRNQDEADYIARLVRGLLLSNEQKSIGIVAFSEAQQSEIEKALNRLADDDRQFRNLLEEEYEREKEGEFVGLLVKNLENIQGDEREIIILSVCYGYNAQKKMRMNFGPINQKGGEKRLNVAFSRAKQHMAIISSIKYSDITNEYNEGANALRTYLQYVESISIGDEQAANRILYGLSYSDLSDKQEQTHSHNNPVLIQIKSVLEKQGWLVDIGVGHSRFKCDLAIRKPHAERYSLGLFLDTTVHYQQIDIIERDLLKPQLLRNFGWKIYNLLSKDWYNNADNVLEHILKLLNSETTNEILDDEPIVDIDEISVSNEPTISERDDLSSNQTPKDNGALKIPQVEESLEVQAPEADSDTAISESTQKSEQTQVSNNISPPPTPMESGDSPTIIANSPVQLSYIEGKSSKFWTINVDTNAHEVHYGRIGTKGQRKTKQFADQEKALVNAQQLINQKIKKGYTVS